MDKKILVALRVRPFNEKESIKCESSCLKLTNNQVLISSGKFADSKSTHTFTFDHCFHGSDHNNTQEKIFNDVGRSVIESACQGYNSCIFAYGQTGSGKTHTMLGSDLQPGLIPRICQALIESMKEKSNLQGFMYNIQVSYLEIYNEKVKDLLYKVKLPKKKSVGVHDKLQPPKLAVRGDKKSGVYVENLTKHLVNEYQEIEKLLKFGSDNRSVGKTLMNSHSSRSHAIFTLTFTQAVLEGGSPKETVSKINLVDLAGSERLKSTGAQGKLLIESQNINKSLSTLSLVISTLCKQSNSKGSSGHVPYRDSVLTWLLQDSIGGNSVTAMIATVSPSQSNYSESLSTLRYACQAKTIVNTPHVNEDENVKTIRLLRSQIADLTAWKMRIIENHQLGTLDDVVNQLSQKQEEESKLTEEWKERWSALKAVLQDQKDLELRKAGLGISFQCKGKHIMLLEQEDRCVSGVMLYKLEPFITTIGTKTDSHVVLNGTSIEPHHCSIIVSAEDSVTLKPQPGAYCVVNQQNVSEEVSINHGAVIILGGSHVFRFHDPQEVNKIKGLMVEGLDNSVSFSNSQLSVSSLADSLLKQSDHVKNCSGYQSRFMANVSARANFSTSFRDNSPSRRALSIVFPMKRKSPTSTKTEEKICPFLKSVSLTDVSSGEMQGILSPRQSFTNYNSSGLPSEGLVQCVNKFDSTAESDENSCVTDGANESFHSALSNASWTGEEHLFQEVIGKQLKGNIQTSTPLTHGIRNGRKFTNPPLSEMYASPQRCATSSAGHSSHSQVNSMDLAEQDKENILDDSLKEVLPKNIAEKVELIIEREVQKRLQK